MATLQRNQGSVFDGVIHFKTCRKDNYSRHFAQLRGKDLFLYSTESRTNKQLQRSVPLTGATSVVKEMTGRAIKQNSAFPTISVTFRNGGEVSEFRLRGNSQTEQEDWYRFLHVICLEQLPDVSNLLPGQIHKLKDIIDSFKYDDVSPSYLDMKPLPTPKSLPKTPASGGRKISSAFPFDLRRVSEGAVSLSSMSPTSPKSVTLPNGPFSPSNMNRKKPTQHSGSRKQSWFLNRNVEREEAEQILNMNKQHGNMILRRRSIADDNDPWNYAVSIKPWQEGEKQYKHYKVREVNEGSHVHYIINLADNDTHERLNSLQEVMDCFIKKSLGGHKPLKQIDNMPEVEEHEYETAVEPRPPFNPQEEYYNVRGGATLPPRDPVPSPTVPRRPPMLTRQTMPEFHNELNNVFGRK